MTDIRKELAKLPGSNHWERRRKYFLWKNKMDTSKVMYSEMTKEELRENLKVTDIEWSFIERWEESDKYKELIYILHKDNFDTDILEVYNAIKDEAIKGNSSAVKTMVELQKEISDRLKGFGKEEVEDDGLKLDI